ncbi:MAG: coproporphyrinogen dehydrogenase HemZ [Hyphomonadaceae bacterium]|nr:coproporphyrinogen dehydrogenase HemZ [Clostridia bacterium]
MLTVYVKGHQVLYDAEHIVRLFFQWQKVQCVSCEQLPEITQETYLTSEFLMQGNNMQSVVTLYFEGKTYTAQASIPHHGKYSRDQKTVIKLALYRALKQAIDLATPWGTMIGIRPAKIVREWLEEGKSELEIIAIMTEQFETKPEKSALVLAVAQAERDILQKISPHNISLYIGIPFCPTRCLYCSFISMDIARAKMFIAPYCDALVQEIKHTVQLVEANGLKIDTIYMGGGTPTALSASQLEKILYNLQANLHNHSILELTVEAGRPDTIDCEKLKVLKQYGTTRLSINPQTMHDKTLGLIGRQHTAEQAIIAFELARSMGFDNINMDLIAGLPEETQALFEQSIEKIGRLSPDSITVHSLSVKRAATLQQDIDQYTMTQAETVSDMLMIAQQYAAHNGYDPYYMYRQKNTLGNLENVGYAQPGKACLYNVLMMEDCQTVIGLGAGSMTKWVLGEGKLERNQNYKHAEEYVKHIDDVLRKKDSAFNINLR